MELEIVGLVASLGSLAASAVIAYTVQAAKSEVLALRVEIAEARLREREEMRQWINGSFMRASYVEARLAEMMHRLEELERARG